MPELDGLEATERIRQLPTGGDVPIVALTAHALESERKKAMELGMTAYLTKPFKSRQLFETVESVRSVVS